MTNDTGSSLIRSDEVKNLIIYGVEGQQIGQIEHLMIDPVSGHVSYAVVSFHGQTTDDLFPLPWSLLKYDSNLNGYVTATPLKDLSNAPRYPSGRGWNWRDRAAIRSIDTHYGIRIIHGG
ncbi:PRC-barrel domain-containing protein [Bradyrhizobium sp. BR 10261]|uniref:PRC-barrel domain-containing protein n=1 Tax=Bradyrhizobium sp. BR 10261 TaxID=2749992 RepID=UPI001C64C779|nr:PRC-barrel domain-containing protein [Bradyrhizobium sp. BR 10261]MBW7964145.1 PRC-barrel domain-containing protein [Bradyrhizobium sp. BR 10261]